jgi:hypothetical protein
LLSGTVDRKKETDFHELTVLDEQMSSSYSRQPATCKEHTSEGDKNLVYGSPRLASILVHTVDSQPLVRNILLRETRTLYTGHPGWLAFSE